MAKRHFWKIVLVGIIFLSFPVNSQAEIEIDRTLYEKQMRAFPMHRMDLNKRREEARRLKEAAERREQEYQRLQSEAVDFEIQAQEFEQEAKQHEQDQNEELMKARQYEEEYKALQQQAVENNKAFWKKQEGFKKHQDEFDRLKTGQNLAIQKAKGHKHSVKMALEKAFQAKQKRKNRLSRAESLKRQIFDLNKQYELIVEPL